jgi:hypothetical protein
MHRFYYTADAKDTGPRTRRVAQFWNGHFANSSAFACLLAVLPAKPPWRGVADEFFLYSQCDMARSVSAAVRDYPGSVLQGGESKAASHKGNIMNKSILTALVCGTMGLASPGFAQGSASSADGARERVVITREVVVTPRVERGSHVALAPTEAALRSGGVGGSIGGYYINGATRSDNLALPGGLPPLK